MPPTRRSSEEAGWTGPSTGPAGRQPLPRAKRSARGTGGGASGYPVEEAAPVALSAVATFLRKEKKAPGLVRFVLFNVETLRAYHEAIEVLGQFPRAPASRALGSPRHPPPPA